VSVLTVSARKQTSIRRPTSDRIFYDVRHVAVGDDPAFVHENFRTPLAGTSQKLGQMLSWQENWNRHGAAKPNALSILNALRWIDHMRIDLASARMRWREPYVVPDANGHIVFEWSCRDRTLSIYISPDTVEYLKVKGPNIYSDMEDGEIVADDYLDLWRWLMEPE